MRTGNVTGRVVTGGVSFVRVRLPSFLITEIDKWAAGSGTGLTRSEAIRRLIELGLAGGSGPFTQRSSKSAAKAVDMAARQIDKIADASATNQERQQRKKRLLKGPSEFMGVREDNPNPKR